MWPKITQKSQIIHSNCHLSHIIWHTTTDKFSLSVCICLLSGLRECGLPRIIVQHVWSSRQELPPLLRSIEIVWGVTICAAFSTRKIWVKAYQPVWFCSNHCAFPVRPRWDLLPADNNLILDNKKLVWITLLVSKWGFTVTHNEEGLLKVKWYSRRVFGYTDRQLQLMTVDCQI